MPATIVYPINGRNFPKINPSCALKSAYLTFSFSVTCEGGPRKVKWGINKKTLGSAEFYDMFSSQFVWKLPKGKHKFWVRSNRICGSETIKFTVS